MIDSFKKNVYECASILTYVQECPEVRKIGGDTKNFREIAGSKQFFLKIFVNFRRFLTKFSKFTTKKHKIFQDWGGGGVTPSTPVVGTPLEISMTKSS